MGCPYAENDFCAGLSSALRKTLCKGCTLTRFPAGTMLDSADWSGTFAVLAEGFCVSADASEEEVGAPSPMNLSGSGHIVTMPRAWAPGVWMHTMDYVILESMVAVFDDETVRLLHEQSAEFAWAVCNGYRRKYEETALALWHIGGKDPRGAIRFMLDFCQRHRLPRLTHAQMALATGLARPTVTKALNDLTRNTQDLWEERA